jgi:hypothetical protein
MPLAADTAISAWDEPGARLSLSITPAFAQLSVFCTLFTLAFISTSP